MRHFNFYKTLFPACFALAVAGCLDLSTHENTPVSMIGVIPKNFDWKTVTELKCTINVSQVTGYSDKDNRTVKIFNSPLLDEGSLITSGSATPSSPYQVTLSLPTALPQVYIQVIMPDGTRKFKIVPVNGKSLNITFSQEDMALTTKAQVKMNTSPAPSIVIPTNYDVTVGANVNLDLTGFPLGESSAFGNQYKSYIIPSGVTRTKVINFGNWISHSILYVQGTYSYTGKSTNLNNATIVILSGGRVELKDITTGISLADIPTIYIQSGGTLAVSGGMNFSNGKYFVNKGTVTFGGNFDISTCSNVYNEGSLTVSKSTAVLDVNTSSFLYNNGEIICDKLNLDSFASLLNDQGTIRTPNWYQTTGSTTNNHGHITVTTSLTVQGTATINNFCNINSTSTTILDGPTFNLFGGSLFKCLTLTPTNLTMNMEGGSMFLCGSINSIWNLNVKSTSDTYAVFKCTGNVASFLYTATDFKGKIEFVHSNLTEGSGTNGRQLYESSFSNGAIISKTQTNNIVGTACNDSEGVIEITPPAIIDNDGDGVPQGVDIDDSDASVAYVSYFPNASTWGTYAFEDMWPQKGDYDVNDIILGFRIAYYTNSANKVARIKMDYNLRAAGSVYTIGTAFQLDKVQASNIASVSGQSLNGTSPFQISSNGTENGVALAVIPIFNRQKDVLSYSGFLNTESGNYTITPDKSITINFITPVEQADVAMDAFNMFIVADNRGNEIHLPTYKGTSKFNTSLAVGWSLYPGDLFKHADGMMWGLMIPETFRYPSELSSIANTYYHFGEWATSGGTSYPDWYKSTSGYVNESLIFQY